MGHRCVPAPFLTKTYQMIEDPSTDDVISWNEMGITFVVWKPVDFARDLLPKYFKHNNFSSFVRQLNTYGFRKIVPDKWEFANEYFKQGEKDLLSEIHRRKAVPISTIQANAGGKSNGRVGGHSSQSNSGEDLGSTSTSSTDPKNQVSDGTTTIIQFSDLSVENEKLRNDNKILSNELAKTKQQCEELIAFLSKYLNVAPDYINRIMMQGSIGPSSHDRFVDTCDNVDDVEDDNEKGRDEEEKECLKLFGVWLKGKKRCPTTNIGGPPVKEMKMMGFHTPWMKMFCSSSRGKSSKVCN